MNYNSTNFKKIYFKRFVTTKLNEKNVEKKDMSKMTLPPAWNNPDFDFEQPWIENKKTLVGYAVPTGKVNGITVLDFDDMNFYYKACELYTDLDKCYTVITRRGRHVYFKYNECINGQKFKEVDVQNNGAFVIGPDTLIKRHNGTTFLYYAKGGGKIIDMPDVLVEYFCKTKGVKLTIKTYNTDINYKCEVTDDECRAVLDKLALSHPQYFENYSDWLTFTGIMRTINKHDIWDEYSFKYSQNNYNEYENRKVWRSCKKELPFNFFTKLTEMPAITFHKKVNEDELYNMIDYNVDTTEYMNRRFIDITYKDFLKYDTIELESGTGTGKSTLVSKLIRRLQFDGSQDTILSIVNLRSLAKQQKMTFKRRGVTLTMYNEDKFNPALIMSKHSCICVNSLWRLADRNFTDKIVYIDEIYSLCMSLTHNDTLFKQRQVYQTLYKIVTTCKKLIISDAHIYNNVMELLNCRMSNNKLTFRHYINSFKKFNGISAIKYKDENKFFALMRAKILDNDCNGFSFACDKKKLVEKWYWKFYEEAPEEIQLKMRLYTADSDTEIEEDWKGLIIFYSPKITTGVDISNIESTEQFIYISGESVSSINLLQMATRTRNMTKLHYYSCAGSCESSYTSFEDCEAKVTEKYLINELGFDLEDIEEYIENSHLSRKSEIMHKNMYIRNSYALDLHGTNITYFFEEELKRCGFDITVDSSDRCKVSKVEMDAIDSRYYEIKDIKYQSFIDSFKEPENMSESMLMMSKRCELLNITTEEEIEKYREVIEDSKVIGQFFNYNGLKKDLNFCEYKIRDEINNKMISGIEKNCWVKIKYVHQLAGMTGITDDLFNIESITMPVLDKANKKLISSIKLLYNKRDGIEIDDYDVGDIKKLYKFMLDNLTNKLKLFSSVKSNARDETRGKHIIIRNEDSFDKYDNLIKIMNTPKNNEDCDDEYDLDEYDTLKEIKETPKNKD